MQPKSAQGLGGKKIRQERPVEEVDQSHAAEDIGGPGVRVGAQGLSPADVAAGSLGIGHALRQGRNVAQAQIKALGANGRHDMRRLAHEGDPPLR